MNNGSNENQENANVRKEKMTSDEEEKKIMDSSEFSLKREKANYPASSEPSLSRAASNTYIRLALGKLGHKRRSTKAGRCWELLLLGQMVSK